MDKHREIKQGLVFNIQRYSLDDGPGIRTVIFLKGCPLKCRWCANPESQQKQPQILFQAELCHSCGKCQQVCPNTKNNSCEGCGKCVKACWYGARKISGKWMTVEQIMASIRKDASYYRSSNGGITLSGGEPLSQIDFTEAILSECRRENIHTAVETCGYVPWNTFERVLPLLDLVYCDFKHIDDAKHHAYTGQGNAQILNNIQMLCDHCQNLIVRIPCIPKFNDDPQTLEQMINTLANMGVKFIELLPFHRFGSGKYQELDRIYDYKDTPPMKPEQLRFALDFGAAYNTNVQIKERRG